jgi:hypothetical protein
VDLGDVATRELDHRRPPVAERIGLDQNFFACRICPLLKTAGLANIFGKLAMNRVAALCRLDHGTGVFELSTAFGLLLRFETPA